MLSQKVKWPSVLLIIAGVLFIPATLLHPNETQEGAFANSMWGPVHIVFALSLFFIIFGLMAFYQNNKLNLFDKITLKLVKISAILLTGLLVYVETLIIPALANSEYSDLLSETGILFGGAFGVALTLSLALAAFSFILLGIFVIYKRISSPIAGILLFGMAPLAFAPPLPYIVGTVGGVATGIGLLWVGISLLQKINKS